MKIKYLIKELEKYNPNLEIGVWNSEGNEIVELCILENQILEGNGFDLVIDD